MTMPLHLLGPGQDVAMRRAGGRAAGLKAGVSSPGCGAKGQSIAHEGPLLTAIARDTGALLHRMLTIVPCLRLCPQTLLAHWERELGVCGLASRVFPFFEGSRSQRAQVLAGMLQRGGGKGRPLGPLHLLGQLPERLSHHLAPFAAVLLTTYGMIQHNAPLLAGDGAALAALGLAPSLGGSKGSRGQFLDLIVLDEASCGGVTALAGLLVIWLALVDLLWRSGLLLLPAACCCCCCCWWWPVVREYGRCCLNPPHLGPVIKLLIYSLIEPPSGRTPRPSCASNQPSLPGSIRPRATSSRTRP